MTKKLHQVLLYYNEKAYGIKKNSAGKRHGLIGKLIEPYPKPIRKSKREALSRKG
jgi:hypothetical protein